MRENIEKTRRNPFPGLRPFREDEQHWFFGRENHVDAMVDKLSETRFLAVIGPSGSGKSSLVNCGLLPALHQGLMASAGTAWRIAHFRPGSEPLEAVAHALAKDGLLFTAQKSTNELSLAEVIEATLNMSKLGLIDIYQQARLADDVNLLVVVDQFEELFRYSEAVYPGQAQASAVGEQATAFVNLLLEANRRPNCPIFVVLTMRSDFLGDCAQFPGLAERINSSQYLIPRMNRDERRLAICGPAAVDGAEISPVLLTRLVNDVGDNPDQLSILQHALNRTWARWHYQGGRDGPLDLAHYREIGTMSAAINEHAEKAYAELDPETQQPLCEKLFRALTDKASDPRGIRHPTKLGTLCDLCELAKGNEAKLIEIIDVFRKPSRSFLTPPGDHELNRETMIDISHESLMRRWQRLKKWSDREAQSARIFNHFSETAARHADSKADLLGDLDLKLAQDWQQRDHPNANWAERYGGGFEKLHEFIRESEQGQKRRRQKRYAILAACLLAPLIVLYLQWQETKRLENITAIQRVATESKLQLDALPQRGLLLALEAVRANKELTKSTGVELPEPEQVLRELLAKTGGNSMMLDSNKLAEITEKVADMALSPPACALRTLALANRDGRLQLVALDGPAAASEPVVFMGEQIHVGFESVAFSPDCAFLAAGSNVIGKGKAEIWLWKLGKLQQTVAPILHMRLPLHDGAIVDVEFSPNGKMLASASLDKTVQLLKLPLSSTGDSKLLEGHEGKVQAVEFSPDGNSIATASSDQTIRIWDLRSAWVDPTPRVRHILRGHDDVVTDVAFSPIGYLLASASWDKTVRVWNLKDGQPERDSHVLHGHRDKVSSVAFSDDRKSLVSASNDRTLRLWQDQVEEHKFETRVETQLLASRVMYGHDARLVAVAFYDGKWLISVGEGELRSWDLRGSATVPQFIRRGDRKLSSKVFAPHGGLLWEPRARTNTESMTPSSGVNKSKHLDRSPDRARVTGRNDESSAKTVLKQRATGDQGSEASQPIERSPNGQFSVSGIGSKALELWRQGQPRTDAANLTGHSGVITHVAFSPDSRWLASADKSPEIRLWDLSKRGHPTKVFAADILHKVTDLAFSSNSSILASASFDRTVRLWSATGRGEQVLRTLTAGKESPVNSVAFSDDDRYLAAANRNGQVRLWDLSKKTEVPLKVWREHSDSVSVVEFSPSSSTPTRLLAAASENKTIRLWNMQALDDPALVLMGHAFKVERLAFSPAAERFAAVGEEDRTIGLWPLSLARLTELACKRIGRTLSEEEKQTFLDDSGPKQPLCSNGLPTFMSE